MAKFTPVAVIVSLFSISAKEISFTIFLTTGLKISEKSDPPCAIFHARENNDYKSYFMADLHTVRM